MSTAPPIAHSAAPPRANNAAATPATMPPPAIVFPTEHQDGGHRLACALLRLSYARANHRLRRLLARNAKR